MSSIITYNAMVTNAAIKGQRLPFIDEIVRDIVLSSHIILKKDEIDRSVSMRINLPLDQSISGATSNALRKLESQNLIVHVKQGYWLSVNANQL